MYFMYSRSSTCTRMCARYSGASSTDTSSRSTSIMYVWITNGWLLRNLCLASILRTGVSEFHPHVSFIPLINVIIIN